MTDIQTLLQFLLEGDIFGFLQAVYVSAFQSNDIFYGLVISFPLLALYIRTRSLLLLSILWILLGSFFIVAMPIVSGLATLLLIMGLAGMLFKLFTRSHR